MLLTIHNLPYTVTFNDIKSLIYSKCGIDEVILDNLVPHDNHTKKVTIGLAGEEDAAIFMKKVDGAFMKGLQLRVVPKSKISKVPTNTNQALSQPGSSNAMQTYMPQGSNWSEETNFRPPLHGMPSQNVPSMVPPPMNFGAPNMFLPNQSAFYMMNQTSYPTPQRAPNLGYQTQPYGNASNQGYEQSSWANNDWNQQEQTDVSQNSPPKKGREVKWDNSSSVWENRNLNFDGNSPKWENSNSKGGNSRWDKNSAPERSNRRESRWNNNGGSNRDSRNDPTSNNTRDSKWQSSRDSNRDNTYRLNQGAGSSRDRDSPNRRYNRNYSPRPSKHGDHGRFSAGDKFNQRQRDNVPQQNRFRSPPRQRSSVDRYRQQLPPHKRERNTMSGYVPDSAETFSVNKTNEPQTQRAVQLGRMWRGQFIMTKAKSILEDPRMQFETSCPGKLLSVLRSAIKRRINVSFQNEIMPMNQLEKKYNKLYGFQGDWVALRDSIQKVGGRLLSKVDAGAENNAPCKFIKKKKLSNPPQYDGVNIQQAETQQQGPQYGGPPQASTSVFTNTQQGGPQQRGPQFGAQPQPLPSSQFANVQQGALQQPTQLRRLPQPLPSSRLAKKKAKAAKQTAKKNSGSVPLAMIPGRIPQYPQGDKKLFKKNKVEIINMLSSDLSAPIFNPLKPAVRKAIEKEVDLMCNWVGKVSDSPENDAVAAKFCKSLKEEVTEEMQRTFKVLLARRMIPILPVSVRVFASPPVKRLPLENFLKNFQVSSLKKATSRQPYYIAECKSIAVHDQLCLMKPVLVDQSLVTFKPLHLVDMKKMPKRHHQEKRQELAKQGTQKTQHQPGPIKEEEPKKIDQNVEAHDDDTNLKKGTADPNEEKSLFQEMKDIYDQINNGEPNENELCQPLDELDYKPGNEQSNEEAFKAFKSVQVIDIDDFTNDVDIENIMDNLREETYNENFAQDNAGDETQENVDNPAETDGNQQNEDNIDMLDVNEEDLEDW